MLHRNLQICVLDVEITGKAGAYNDRNNFNRNANIDFFRNDYKGKIK